MEKNLKLDVLKNIACFGVVALHMFAPTQIQNLKIYYVFAYSIPIFFMVNGFLLLNKKEVTYKYVMKKIFNLIRLIFVWNTLLFVIELLKNNYAINPILETLNNLVQKGYFFQFWFFGSIIIIYLILPIYHKLLNKSKTNYLIILGTTGLINIFINAINIKMGINWQPIFTQNVIQTFRVWIWLFYFTLGGFLGKYQPTFKFNKLWIISLVVCTVFVVKYQYYMGINIYHNTYAEYFYGNIPIIIYVILIWVNICMIDFDKFKNNIEFINGSIIITYIVHTTLIVAIGQIFKYYYDNILINIIFYIIVLLLCICIDKIIDKIPKANKIFKLN